MNRPVRAETFERSDLVVDYDPDTLERRDVLLDTVTSLSHPEWQRLLAAANAFALREPADVILSIDVPRHFRGDAALALFDVLLSGTRAAAGRHGRIAQAALLSRRRPPSAGGRPLTLIRPLVIVGGLLYAVVGAASWRGRADQPSIFSAAQRACRAAFGLPSMTEVAAAPS